MGLFDFKKRSSILGLPIGPKKMDWGKIAKMGIAGASTIASVVGSVRGKQAAQDRLEEPIEKGKEALGQASDIGDKAADVSDAVSGGGGLIGKAKGAMQALGGGGGGDDGNLKKPRLIINEYQDVGVPLKVAYNQWTQFEELPDIMKGVKSVEQEEDETTKWTVKIGPSSREWTAEITEQTPDERIAWESKGPAQNKGVVSFHSLDKNLTRIQVEMEYTPSGFIEKIGNLFLAARNQTRKDLRLFKHYIELAGEETGAWRGEISKEEEEGQEESAESSEETDEEQAEADEEQAQGGESEASDAEEQEPASEDTSSDEEEEEESTTSS